MAAVGFLSLLLAAARYWLEGPSWARGLMLGLFAEAVFLGIIASLYFGWRCDRHTARKMLWAILVLGALVAGALWLIEGLNRSYQQSPF
jgi:hypothetical protein